MGRLTDLSRPPGAPDLRAATAALPSAPAGGSMTRFPASGARRLAALRGAARARRCRRWPGRRRARPAAAGGPAQGPRPVAAGPYRADAGTGRGPRRAAALAAGEGAATAGPARRERPAAGDGDLRSGPAVDARRDAVP